MTGETLITGNGYTFDTFAGEENAPFFLGVLIGKITGNPDGFLSNHREWHILLKAVWAGARAKTLENVPDCPPLWVDEEQYWNTPAMIVNVIKCQWPSISVFLAALGTKILGLW